MKHVAGAGGAQARVVAGRGWRRRPGGDREREEGGGREREEIRVWLDSKVIVICTNLKY